MMRVVFVGPEIVPIASPARHVIGKHSYLYVTCNAMQVAAAPILPMYLHPKVYYQMITVYAFPLVYTIFINEFNSANIPNAADLAPPRALSTPRAPLAEADDNISMWIDGGIVDDDTVKPSALRRGSRPLTSPIMTSKPAAVWQQDWQLALQ